MDVRERLVEILKRAPFEGKVLDEWWWEEKIKRIVDHLISNGVTGQEWISVKDRLPEHGESVLTYKNGIVDIQMYEKNRNGWISDNWFWSMATVTHWMPIPAPPEVKQ